MDVNIKEGIISQYEKSLERIPIILKKIDELTELNDQMIRALIRRHEVQFWYERCVADFQDNTNTFIQLNILASLTNLIKDKGSLMAWPKPEVMYILLSSNQKIVEEFKSWDFILHGRNDYGGGYVEGVMPIIYFLLNGEKEMAEKELIYAKGQASWKGSLKTTLLFAEGLLEDSVEKMEDAIQNLLRPSLIRRIQKVNGIGEKIITTPTTIMIKTAWILGYKISVESPLVPMDLIEVKSDYKFDLPYDFLKY